MLNLLNALSGGSAVFLAFLVFTVRRDTNDLANRWLAAFLLGLGAFILDENLALYGIYAAQPWMIGLFALPTFALAPTLYLCVSQFVSVEKRFHRRQLWHFLPALLFMLLLIPDSDSRLYAFFKNNILTQQLNDLLLYLLVLQIIGYWILSLRRLWQHRKNLENITATPDSVGLDWLLYFLYGVGGLAAIWIFELLWLPSAYNATWAAPGYLAGIYFLGYFALRQREVFPFLQNEVSDIQEIFTENDRSASLPGRAIFSVTELESLKRQLLDLMENKRAYLDNELTLPALARQMGLGTHGLSHLINEGFGVNFYQFVNRFRVNESKRLLRSDQYAHLNLVGIAYEAGFNSKTAFNTAFKKMTGVSPVEFRDGQETSPIEADY